MVGIKYVVWNHTKNERTKRILVDSPGKAIDCAVAHLGRLSDTDKPRVRHWLEQGKHLPLILGEIGLVHNGNCSTILPIDGEE